MIDTVAAVVFEDSTFSLMARFEIDGANAQQADVSSISIKAWDVDDLTTEVLDASLDKTQVVYDTLQTDSRWSEDSTGYNFRYDVEDTVCASAGIYLFRVTVNTTGGKIPRMQWRITARKLEGS